MHEWLLLLLNVIVLIHLIRVTNGTRKCVSNYVLERVRSLLDFNVDVAIKGVFIINETLLDPSSE